MCEVASFKNFENSLTTVKVMMKNEVAPFYLGHGVIQFTSNHFSFCSVLVLEILIIFI